MTKLSSLFATGILLITCRTIGWAAAPSLSLSAPVSSHVDEVVLVDGRLSSGISKLPQADGDVEKLPPVHSF